jgi:hypothetical protein
MWSMVTAIFASSAGLWPGHRPDQATDPAIAGLRRHRGQRCPALIGGLLRVDQTVEVVVVPDAVEAEADRAVRQNSASTG